LGRFNLLQFYKKELLKQLNLVELPAGTWASGGTMKSNTEMMEHGEELVTAAVSVQVF
jgi:hypothetical protein